MDNKKQKFKDFNHQTKIYSPESAPKKLWGSICFSKVETIRIIVHGQ